MGLDLVEFVLAVETSFGVEIPDPDAERLMTPRDVVEFLAGCLAAAESTAPACLTQRAFHRTRTAMARRFGVDGRALRPATSLLDVLPADDCRRQWEALKEDLGVESWPPVPSGSWLGKRVFASARTVGDLAEHLATHNAAALKGPGAGWTRGEIARTVTALLEAEFGLDMSRHPLDAEFIRDLGLD
jgi:hypothetical protein